MSTVLAAGVLAGCSSAPPVAVSAEPIAVVAAGSLREALTEIARGHGARRGMKQT